MSYAFTLYLFIYLQYKLKIISRNMSFYLEMHYIRAWIAAFSNKLMILKKKISNNWPSHTEINWQFIYIDGKLITLITRTETQSVTDCENTDAICNGFH